MYEFLVGFQPAYGVELLLDEVFHGLDVVVCHLLYVLHAACVGLGKVCVDGAQAAEEAMVERGQLRQRQFAQGYEVLNLYAHSVAYERILGEIGGQRLGFGAVAPVYRRYGCQ